MSVCVYEMFNYMISQVNLVQFKPFSTHLTKKHCMSTISLKLDNIIKNKCNKIKDCLIKNLKTSNNKELNKFLYSYREIHGNKLTEFPLAVSSLPTLREL